MTEADYRIRFNRGGTVTVIFKDGASVTLPARSFGVRPEIQGYHKYHADAFAGIRRSVPNTGQYGRPVSEQSAREALRYEAAPEWIEGGLVETGGYTDTPGPGSVQHLVTGDGIVVNKTVGKHPLHPGYVVRHVIKDGNALKAKSVGFGNSNFWGPTASPVLNNWLGELIFSDPFGRLARRAQQLETARRRRQAAYGLIGSREAFPSRRGMYRRRAYGDPSRLHERFVSGFAIASMRDSLPLDWPQQMPGSRVGDQGRRSRQSKPSLRGNRDRVRVGGRPR